MMEHVHTLHRPAQPEHAEEAGPMVVEVVTFASRLHEKDVVRTIEERLPEYRAVAGLVQKLYVREPSSGEFGGIYVWDNPAAAAAFRDSDLARTIAKAYRTRERPRLRRFEIVSIL